MHAYIILLVSIISKTTKIISKIIIMKDKNREWEKNFIKLLIVFISNDNPVFA